MAHYHLSAQIVKRSAGRNSVAMSAYRSGEALTDRATDLVKDYRAKTKIFGSEIFTPQGAPAWMSDRENLWNSVEAAEKRKDAQLAREFNIALHQELTAEQNQMLIRDYVQTQFVKTGMVADVAYHNFGGDNPHAHIMLTTRKVDGDKFGGKVRDWNEHSLMRQWREAWQNKSNEALAAVGVSSRIDHRTLVDQGIDREPQIHVGPSWHADEPSIRMIRNNEILARNSERERIKKELESIDKELGDLERNERLLERADKDKANKSRHNRGVSLSGLPGVALVRDQGQSLKKLSALPVLSQLGSIDRYQDIPMQTPGAGGRPSDRVSTGSQRIAELIEELRMNREAERTERTVIEQRIADQHKVEEKALAEKIAVMQGRLDDHLKSQPKTEKNGLFGTNIYLPHHVAREERQQNEWEGRTADLNKKIGVGHDKLEKLETRHKYADTNIQAESEYRQSHVDELALREKIKEDLKKLMKLESYSSDQVQNVLYGNDKDYVRKVPRTAEESEAAHIKMCRIMADSMHKDPTLTYDPSMINSWPPDDQKDWEVKNGYRQPEPETGRPGPQADQGDNQGPRWRR